MVGHDRLAGHIGGQRIGRKDALSTLRPPAVEGDHIGAMLLDRHQRPLQVETELGGELPPAAHDGLRVSRGAEPHGTEGSGAEPVARRKARDVDDGFELYRGDRSASLFAAQQLVDLVFDLLQVHEGTVDGGKPDVGDFIEAAQLVHH